MKRTQIQLTDSQYSLVKEISKKKDVSMSEVIRESVESLGLALLLDSKEDKYERAINSIGRFKSSNKDLSINHDKYLSRDCEE